MKEKILYCIWAVLYITCAVLGFITERGVVAHIVLSLFSLGFFVPGVLLLHHGLTTGNRGVLFRVRLVSIASLVATLSLIVISILTVFAGEETGQVINDLLILVSAPMFCSYFRGGSLFLWACLFVISFPRMWKK